MEKHETVTREILLCQRKTDLLRQVGPETWTLNILHLQGFKTGASGCVWKVYPQGELMCLRYVVCERSFCRAASRLSFQIRTRLINVIVDFSSKQMKNASAAPSLLGLDARNVFLRIHRTPLTVSKKKHAGVGSEHV